MEEQRISKKRNLDDSKANEPSSATREDPDDTNTAAGSKSRPACLKLEAIFYPKFENEQRNQEVRRLMKEKVSNNKGTLEVSLKHSGSLLLWSGGQRFYSKNDADNAVTLVGEVLLRQHFVRAFWNERNEAQDLEHSFSECSDFIQTHRLTLAFEVVTAVLGDHGQRPKRDFMILTAVASRAHASFYNTQQLVELAHRFRLPHNETFVFSSSQSVEALFSLYDHLFETGKADTVGEALKTASDLYLPSIYPHMEFQGDLLEGIVVRFVNGRSFDTAIVTKATQLTEAIPFGRNDGHQLMMELVDSSSAPAVLSLDLRALYREENCAMEQFASRLRNILSQSGSRRLLERKHHSFQFDVTVSNECTQSSNESSLLASLFQTVEELNLTVRYKFFVEICNESGVSPPEGERKYCVVQVLRDDSFKKYRKACSRGDLELFRGFVVEICNSDDDEKFDHPTGSPLPFLVGNETEDDPLMLKMKFLPYMVRTFGCRNGLAVLRKSGSAAFLNYANRLLEKWQVVGKTRDYWLAYFGAWASYDSSLSTSHAKVKNEATNLPALLHTCYLDHLRIFESLYTRGQIKNISDKSETSFQGCVIVVAPRQSDADGLASKLSQLLHANRVESMQKVPEQILMMSQRGMGAVCSTDVTTGLKRLRKLLNEHGDIIGVIMYGCTDSALNGMDLDQNEKKRITGMIKSLKMSQYCNAWGLDPASLSERDASLSDSSFQAVVNACKSFSVSLVKDDNGFGLLVFFPGIPGCGKVRQLFLCILYLIFC
jgi:hypothetical protein